MGFNWNGRLLKFFKVGRQYSTSTSYTYVLGNTVHMSYRYNLGHTKCLEKCFISPRNYYSNQALLCRNSHLDIFGSVYVYMQVLWAMSLCAVCTLTIRRFCQFKDPIIYFFDVRSLSRHLYIKSNKYKSSALKYQSLNRASTSFKKIFL